MTEWKPISALFDIEKGNLQSSKCTPGEFVFITAASEWKTHNSYSHDCEALVFAMAASGSLGRTHYFRGKFIASDLCFILTPKKGLKLDLLFYHRLFNFLRKDIVKKTAAGTSKLSINQTHFGLYMLPYFDYEHQICFRDKIETFADINNNNNIQISAQLDIINKLRQQILQEAIEGKLTAKWRKEHPELVSGENHASKLLEKIKTEKDKLSKEGKIKGDNPLSPITDEEKAFDLPEGWMWSRMGDICDFITKGTTPSTYELKSEGEIPYLKVYNIVNQKIDFFHHPQFISNKIHEKLNRSKVYPGDILMNIVGPPLGKVAIIPDSFKEWNINQALAIFRCVIKEMNCFLYLYLLAGFEVKKIHTLGIVGQDNISLAQCRNIIFPIPPSAEQMAIVERLGSLLAMIDGLEKQVSERKELSETLMQSVLREAFSDK